MDEKQTNPFAAGSATTEGRLTIAAVVSTTLIAAVTAVAPLLSEAARNNPNVIWLQIAAVAVMGALGTAGLFGLTKGRSANKGNQILGILEKGGEVAAVAMLNHFLKPYQPQKTGEELDAAATARAPGTFPPAAPSGLPTLVDLEKTPAGGTPGINPNAPRP